jgi:hypothetical protein
MSRIFISYRRSDGTKDASRLAEDLGAIFGPEQVFFDQYDMQGGRSWREQILAAMDEPPVVALLVITPNYFGEQRNGQLRILGEEDAVRLELHHAMQVQAHLLPALTDLVSMPARSALPEELHGLPELHAPPLRSRDWRKTDLPELADAIIRLGIKPRWPDWRERNGYPIRAGSSDSGTPDWTRWLRHPAVLAGLAVACGGLGYLGYDAWQDQQAQKHLFNGLAAYSGKDPNPVLARSEYLLAIGADPELGAAHYYLAHIYASIPQRDDAREQFQAALRHPVGLDHLQIQDARERIKELEQVEAEPAPVQLGAARSPGSGNGGGGSSNDEPAAAGAAPVPAPVPTAPAPAPDVVIAQVPARSATGSGSGLGAGSSRPASAATGVPVVVGADGRITLAARAVPALTGRTQDLIGRVAMSPDQHKTVEQQVEQLFGGDLQARLSAATTLATDTELSSDAVTLALRRSVDALRTRSDDEAVRAGVVGVMRLLQNASPATLQANRPQIDQLMSELSKLPTLTAIQGGAVSLLRRVQDSSNAPKPTVFLQIADEAQRPLAQKIVSRLVAAGYQVPVIENVGRRAPSRTEIRVQGTSNQALARWMQQALTGPTGAPIRLSTLSKAHPANDIFELWLDKSLCLSADRQVPGCSS